MTRTLFNTLALLLAFLYVASIGFVLATGITRNDIMVWYDANKSRSVVEAPRPRETRVPVAVPEQEKVPEKPTLAPLSGKVDVKEWAYYIKNVDLAQVRASKKPLVVMNTSANGKAFSKDDIDGLKKTPSGERRTVLAYLSLGEAESYRSYWKDSWDNAPPAWLGEQDITWAGVFKIKDLMSKEWTIISKRLINDAMSAGYDGILVAGLSVRQKDALLYLRKASEHLRKKDSRFLIFVQDFVTPEIVGLVDGVVKQGLSYGLDGSSTAYLASDMKALKELRGRGMPVLVIEYVSGDKWAKAKKVIEENGFAGYHGPVELNKILED